MLLRASRSLSGLRSTARLGARRMMCTVAEEAPPGPFAISEPHNQKMYAMIFTTYLFALKWQSADRSLAREIAEHKAAHAPAEPAAAEPEAAVAAAVETPAAAAPAAVSPVVAAVAAAPAGASPATWKTGDVAAWLESIELPMHAESFKAHSVNGKMLLALSDQDLYSTLGVTSPLHRKKLLMEISALRKSYLGP